jgi:hypothetical protein
VRPTGHCISLLALIVGCASAPDPGPDSSPEAALEDLVCARNATVTVRVDNRSSMDLRITFGSYRPVRPADGFSRTTYQIARYHLQGPIRLEVLRGGMQIGGPATIRTEPVFCNAATLVIGSRPEYSVFYGDEIFTPSDLLEADSAEVAADSIKPKTRTRGTGW